MVLVEDITPLVGGLDFDVISPDVKKQIAVATRKLFHKTPESRKKGRLMLTMLSKSVPKQVMKEEVDKTAKDYVDIYPSRAEVVIGGTLMAYKSIHYFGNLLVRATKYAERQYNVAKNAPEGFGGYHPLSWSDAIKKYIRMELLFRWHLPVRAPEAPKFNMFKYLDENYGQTPAWKWMKHGKIVPSGVQRKPSSFVRALPFITAGVVGAAAIKQHRMRQRQLTYKNAVDAFNARLDKLWDSGDKVGYYKLLADLSDYLPKK